MAHALTLTASSAGRAPVFTGDGATLLVDDANAVMITAAPDPSSWEPEGLTLYRGSERVTTPPMSDGTRWVLMGDDRFGAFHARATAAGVPVESPAVRVVPATVSLRPDPGRAITRPPAAPEPTDVAARQAGAAATTLPATPVGPVGTAATAALPPAAAHGDARALDASAQPSRVGEPTQVAALASAPSPSPALAAGTAPARAPEEPGTPAEPPTPAPVQAAGSAATPADPAAVAAATPTPAAWHNHPSEPSPAPAAATAPASPAPSPAPAPADPAPVRPQGVVEVPLSEYDGRFAAVVAALFSVLALGVLTIVAAQVIGDLIIAAPISAEAPSADSGSRSGRATSALLIAVGSILLLAAAATAALDVRGRQRRVADTPTALRGTQLTLDKAPGILENPGRLRSMIALLITGVVVLLIGFVGQVHWG